MNTRTMNDFAELASNNNMVHRISLIAEAGRFFRTRGADIALFGLIAAIAIAVLFTAIVHPAAASDAATVFTGL